MEKITHNNKTYYALLFKKRGHIKIMAGVFIFIGALIPVTIWGAIHFILLVINNL